MAKVDFGEFSGFTNRGQIKYMKNNKLVSEDIVPPEVVGYIKKKLTPHLLAADKQPVASPEPAPVEEADIVPPLTPEDFEDEPTPAELPPAELPSVSEVTPDFLESVSIHTASLEDMTSALYERFGIYTVYLQRMPASDEINPLTAEPFTKYHLGVAYQAAIKAHNSGVLRRAPEANRKAIDAGRLASENHRDTFVPPPQNMGEAREQNTFAHRTSVRGSSGYGMTPKGELVAVPDESGEMHSERQVSPNGMQSVRHPDEEEPLAQPPQRGKKIIRPDW